MHEIHVIGAGLAGCEAAWQIARQGIRVKLFEMKPNKKTPAHHSDDFAELVCSNSLRSDQLENAVGLLKEELRRLGSLIMSSADANRVRQGSPGVDRHGFFHHHYRSHMQRTLIEVYTRNNSRKS
jgi:methylenetetrahydrofolate--tRNA-(uracil-5-)-methyltransferase